MALWTPAEITTALWLDAADSSTLFDAVTGGAIVIADSAVARWEDKSGNARHVTQSNVSARPARKVNLQNSLDILRFDGFNDFFNASLGLFRNKSYVGMFFVVIEKDATSRTLLYASTNDAGFTRATVNTSQNVQFSGGRRLNTDSYRQTSEGGGSSGANIIMGEWNYQENAIKGFRNGSQVGSGNTFSSGAGLSDDTDSGIIELGQGFSQRSNHDWCEVLLVEDPALDTRQTVEGYLAWKWGLQGNLPNDHPYKNAAPTIGRRRNNALIGLL